MKLISELKKSGGSRELNQCIRRFGLEPTSKFSLEKCGADLIRVKNVSVTN